MSEAVQAWKLSVQKRLLTWHPTADHTHIPKPCSSMFKLVWLAIKYGTSSGSRLSKTLWWIVGRWLQIDTMNYTLEWQVDDSAGLSHQDTATSETFVYCPNKITIWQAGIKLVQQLHCSDADSMAQFLGHLQQNSKSLLVCRNLPERRAGDSQRCVTAGLEALTRVANSEGSHKISSLNMSSAIPDRKTAITSLASSGTINANVHCVAKILPHKLYPSPFEAYSPSKMQSVSITGGLGALGQLNAHFLAQLESSSISLLSRSGRGPVALSLTEGFARVSLVRCDVSSAEEVCCFAEEQCKDAKLSQILHTGGVLKDAVLTKQTPSLMREVAAPKVNGLLNLLESCMGTGTQITAFSSIAGVLGSSGQGNYAAANSVMDSMASHAADQVCAFFWLT